MLYSRILHDPKSQFKATESVLSLQCLLHFPFPKGIPQLKVSLHKSHHSHSSCLQLSQLSSPHSFQGLWLLKWNVQLILLHGTRSWQEASWHQYNPSEWLKCWIPVNTTFFRIESFTGISFTCSSKKIHAVNLHDLKLACLRMMAVWGEKNKTKHSIRAYYSFWSKIY